MDEELEMIMWQSCFDELSSIEKEGMEKGAIAGLGAIGKAVAAKGSKLLNAAGKIVNNPSGAAGLMKSQYTAGGGGLAGVKKVLGTQTGQAAAIGAGGALATGGLAAGAMARR